MLPDGQKVCQNLGGVKFIGQAVPHRDTGEPAQILHDFLPVTPVLDSIVHPSQHPGGIGYALLLANLRGRGIQEGAVHSQVIGGNLKGAAGAGGGFLKNQRNILSLAVFVGDALLFLCL